MTLTVMYVASRPSLSEKNLAPAGLGLGGGLMPMLMPKHAGRTHLRSPAGEGLSLRLSAITSHDFLRNKNRRKATRRNNPWPVRLTTQP